MDVERRAAVEQQLGHRLAHRGRMLEAVPISGTWQESTLTWFNQPGTAGTAVTVPSREGYQEWNVTSHVLGMLESGVSDR